jgi:hypothetical protein
MVGHVQAFLRLIQASLPDLLGVLGSARMWMGAETHIEHSVYERVPLICFSQHVLSAETDQLVVLRLNDVGWSDLGDPRRAFMAARESGCEPGWIQDWGRAKGVAVELPEKAAAVA